MNRLGAATEIVLDLVLRVRSAVPVVDQPNAGILFTLLVAWLLRHWQQSIAPQPATVTAFAEAEVGVESSSILNKMELRAQKGRELPRLERS